MVPTARPARRLAPGDAACWVLKTSLPPEQVAPGWAPGAEQVLARCVRPSYRLGLVAPGQAVLLWLSGRSEPGVHAVGTVAAAPEPAGGPGQQPSVRVALRRLADPVPREELVEHPVFAAAEVVRMPAGSNPSYLTAAQLAVVRERLGAEDRRRAGW
ncbi:hypothetical protein [Quadrisphaera sp. DSM 44207]|uniref:hypothetical protein n=1 Tax=Quadrisphaera sp. DSM 44207 TaxID=1881057 RepID=UPI000887A241|nr:hypothetical protein [Quadrisphaera sp. DSM 44207]SDQ04031.1 hypothetical protein SAMN05428996_0047 [Quadrisphaera sp. DSM 44207]